MFAERPGARRACRWSRWALRMPVAPLCPPHCLLPARRADLSLTQISLWGDREKGEIAKAVDTGQVFYSGSIQRGLCKEPGGIVALPGTRLVSRADPKPGPCMVGYLGYLT